MPGAMGRRGFLSGSLIAGAAVAGFKSLEESILQAAMASGEDKKATGKTEIQGDMPMGTLGKHQVSRLISGGNLLSGWCHQRDMLFVSQLAQAYLEGSYTERYPAIERSSRTGSGREPGYCGSLCRGGGEGEHHAKTDLPHVQRLHHRAAQWHDFWLLSPRQILLRQAGVSAVEGCEKESWGVNS